MVGLFGDLCLFVFRLVVLFIKHLNGWFKLVEEGLPLVVGFGLEVVLDGVGEGQFWVGDIFDFKFVFFDFLTVDLAENGLVKSEVGGSVLRHVLNGVGGPFLCNYLNHEAVRLNASHGKQSS